MRTGLSVFLILGGIALGGDTQMLFNPGKADVGPFPSDLLTVADSQQKTGRRVNLPVQIRRSGANGVHRSHDVESARWF